MNNVLELKGKRFVQASKQRGGNGISMNSKKVVTIEHLIRLIDKLHQIKSFWEHEKKPFQGVLISVLVAVHIDAISILGGRNTLNSIST